MSWAHLQTVLGADGAAGANANTIAITLSTVSNNSLVVGFATCNNAATINTVTDDKGNSYTLLDLLNDTNNFERQVLFYKEGITNGPTVVTANLSISTDFRRMAASEYSGILTAAAIDGHNGQIIATPGTGANVLNPGAFTTTGNGDLIWCCVTNDGGGPDTLSAGTSPNAFTQRAVGSSSDHICTLVEDFLQTSAASITPTVGTTINNSKMLNGAGFKISSGGSVAILRSQICM